MTIQGNCGDVVIFQITGAFNLAALAQIKLTGGITASTVFFAVTGAVNTGDSAVFNGVVLSIAAIGFGANTIATGGFYTSAALNLGSGTVLYTPMACQAPSGGCTSSCGTQCPMPNPNAYSNAPSPAGK